MEENFTQQPTIILKIALYGPESTGKTTLAKQLSEHFNTVWIPEFAREYLQDKWNSKKEIGTFEDLVPIAIGQIQLENEAVAKAHQYLFCDTNLMVTKVFSEVYYGKTDAALDHAARQHHYDLFLLTDVDVPWEKDDLRDNPENRELTFEAFKKALIENQKPFIIITGNKEQRLSKAVRIINDLNEVKKMGLTSHDFIQIYEHKIAIATIKEHLSIFENGIKKIMLERPATLNDGILALEENDFDYYADLFDQKKDRLKLINFVPASGAASRMFKFLSEFINEYEQTETINAYINRKKDKDLPVFLAGIEKFPFYEATDSILRKRFPDFENWGKDKKIFHFIQLLLSENEFNYAGKPKAVLPFHKYHDHIATPIEEHLLEAAHYSSANKQPHIHFTVAEQHRGDFEEIISNIKPKIEAAFEVTINVSFSYQDKASDTIAVTKKNRPFRDENGKLIFRPAGHGALIQNLNALEAAIVFIKNIDNVIQEQTAVIARYKKALAGILVALQEKVFYYLQCLDTMQTAENKITEMIRFAEQELHHIFSEDFYKYTLENKADYLKNIFNRPVRVCGMVKNEGEPGGGPFWVRDEKGRVSLQIVESSQIDTNNPQQMMLLKKATHFNPVDVVCGIKNYKNEKFDLNLFVDKNTGFIVEKHKHGKTFKAYELPGLWNGAMSKWITVFVQVPIITFNPVKTVNDLLKPAHQPFHKNKL
jgi:nicotinamide riboside kinase